MNSKSRELCSTAACKALLLLRKKITDWYMNEWIPYDQYDECEDIAISALTEQKCEAKWELGGEYEFAYCSHCGHQQWASWDSHQEAMENIGEFHKEYKFCPNCGFEMKGTSEDTIAATSYRGGRRRTAR